MSAVESVSDVFVLGHMKNPSGFCDFHQGRICRMLGDTFVFSSLDDGMVPRSSSILLNRAWGVGPWYYRICWLLNHSLHHITVFYGTPYDNRIGRRMVGLSDLVVCVSQNTMNESIRRFGLVDYRVIYDGVDGGFYKPDSKKKKNTRLRVLMVVTNLTGWRNHHMFLGLARMFPGVEFVLRTWTPLENELKNLTVVTTKYPYSNSNGESVGLRDLYTSCDLYVFPSVMEGLNNTVLEAMSCGLPVVGLDVSSMPELIEDGRNGFLCKNLRDMSRGLQYFVDNPNEVVRMGKMSRKIASWYTWERAAEGYKEIYTELLT